MATPWRWENWFLIMIRKQCLCSNNITHMTPIAAVEGLRYPWCTFELSTANHQHVTPSICPHPPLQAPQHLRLRGSSWCAFLKGNFRKSQTTFLGFKKHHQRYVGVNQKIWENPPKSWISILWFSIIFTIHFGGFPPIFGNTHVTWLNFEMILTILAPVLLKL